GGHRVDLLPVVDVPPRGVAAVAAHAVEPAEHFAVGARLDLARVLREGPFQVAVPWRRVVVLPLSAMAGHLVPRRPGPHALHSLPVRRGHGESPEGDRVDRVHWPVIVPARIAMPPRYHPSSGRPPGTGP